MNHSLWRIAHRLYQGGRISHQFGRIAEIVYNKLIQMRYLHKHKLKMEQCIFIID